MNVAFYLIIAGKEGQFGPEDDEGYKPFVSARQPVAKTRKPALKADEVALRLDLDIPDKLFRKPVITIKSMIPEQEAMGTEITAELADRIVETIEDRHGIKVEIGLPSEE